MTEPRKVRAKSIFFYIKDSQIPDSQILYQILKFTLEKHEEKTVSLKTQNSEPYTQGF